MILDRLVFTYKDKPIIEKVRIKTPFRYEAIFPNEGCFLYVVGSQTRIHSSETTLMVPPGHGALLKCGHYFVDWIGSAHHDTVEVMAFHLDHKVLRQLYQQELPQLVKDQINGKQVSQLANESVIERFIENLQFYFDNPALVNEDVLELKVKELILLLLQSSSASSIAELLADLFTPRAVGLKEVISTHLYSDLSVSELAQLCGMSISSFKREFEKVFKESPNNYLIIQRINKACELLRASELSISEIAFETGFNDPAYFARIFKKRLKTTPSDYRLSKMS